ncbi:hypothetical protein [Mycolicibacterium obuense]|uniref:hypothetical protein n=1 Tax=Mycolicibacterium obuense TaxID=1807 RepID=UPI000ADBAC2F|nr:hypothetical protein [Mycolicibacterium obuense]
MKPRRGPWLGGLLAAIVVTVWMVGQVIGGLFAMATHSLPIFPTAPPPGFGTAPSGFTP